MKILPIALSLVLFLFISSCKEKKTEPKPHIDLDPEFKEYFVPDYGVGTKLIYVDSVQNITEVAEVMEIIKLNGTLNAGYTSENYKYEMASNLTERYIYDIRQTDRESNFRIFLTSSYHVVSKMKDGSWEPTSNVRILDSVEVYGTTYYDVLESSDTGVYFEKIWIAKNVGIITKFGQGVALYLKEIEKK